MAAARATVMLIGRRARRRMEFDRRSERLCISPTHGEHRGRTPVARSLRDDGPVACETLRHATRLHRVLDEADVIDRDAPVASVASVLRGRREPAPRRTEQDPAVERRVRVTGLAELPRGRPASPAGARPRQVHHDYFGRPQLISCGSGSPGGDSDSNWRFTKLLVCELDGRAVGGGQQVVAGRRWGQSSRRRPLGTCDRSSPWRNSPTPTGSARPPYS
jgi:hypothetical protein